MGQRGDGCGIWSDVSDEVEVKRHQIDDKTPKKRPLREKGEEDEEDKGVEAE